MTYTPPKTKTERRRFPDGTETYVEVETDVDRITRTRVYRGAPQVERTNCFCCSCNDYGDGLISSDPGCRNHGFAGTRPCEEHNMPGQEWDDFGIENDPDVGKMPESVQVKRAADKARWDEWKAKQGA